jgi:uncharacterized membrane protein YkoI
MMTFRRNVIMLQDWPAAAGEWMILIRTTLTGMLVLAATATATAADHCFSRNEQKAKAAAHAVVPLSRVMRQVKQHGEVIRARLCEHGDKLVYQLTVLATDGKVAHTSVDAAEGALPGPRAQGK